jgi:hypothetical protein
MRQYVLRWLVAILLVAPFVCVVVSLADRLLDPAGNAVTNSDLWVDVLNMFGFYGGYVILGGTLASFAHTAIMIRSAKRTQAVEVGWAIVVGVLALVPQALAFGRDYWLANLVTGIIAGALYGAVASRIVPIRAV